MNRRLLTLVGCIALAQTSGCAFWVPGASVAIQDVELVRGNASMVSAHGLVGAEDLTIHPQTGVAYISSDDRWGGTDADSVGGALWAYDTQSGALTCLTNADNTDPHSFHPHGLSLWRDPAGCCNDRLFVINHAASQHEPNKRNLVEIFEIDGGELTHVRTVSDHLPNGARTVYELNDLTAVGPDSFYATHPSYRFEASLLRSFWDSMTTLFFRAQITAEVVHFDGSAYHSVSHAIGFANGITADEAGENLYVSSSQTGEVFVFAINRDTGRLQLRQTLAVGGLLDNIEWQDRETILVSSHSSSWRLLFSSAIDFDVPGRVLRMGIRGTQAGEAAGTIDPRTVECLFEADGEPLSGISAAAIHQKVMLLGQVYREGVARLELW